MEKDLFKVLHTAIISLYQISLLVDFKQNARGSPAQVVMEGFSETLMTAAGGATIK